jgi:hypothetical protein
VSVFDEFSTVKPSALGLVVASCEELRELQTSLVLAPDVIVRHEFTNQATKMPLAERQDPIQAFLLDRSDEAFRVRISTAVQY